MRPWHLILLAFITSVLALGFAWHPLWVVTYVIIGALAFALLWHGIGLRGLVFRRTAPGGHAQAGERIEEELILENHSRLPKLWVQVLDSSSLPGHHAGYVTSIGGRERVTWRVRTLCQRRGRYTLGPVTAITGDPLGLFKRVSVLSEAVPLLVLPTVIPIKSFALYPGGQVGRGRGSRRSLQTTTNVVTVRNYVHGDPLARIHWPSTARTGQFMVKEFDLDPSVDVMIVLDLDQEAQAGEDKESTVEYGVTLAASIASHLLTSRDLTVGLVLNGTAEPHLPMDRGARQLDRALELLAMAEAQQKAPLIDALTELEAKAQRGTALIVITPSITDGWTNSLAQMGRRGVKPAVFLLNAASFARSKEGVADEDLGTTVESLVAHNVPVTVVNKGDDLAAVLEFGGMTNPQGATEEVPA